MGQTATGPRLDRDPVHVTTPKVETVTAAAGNKKRYYITLFAKPSIT